MATVNLFGQVANRHDSVWTVKCVLIAGAIAFGWIWDCLKTTCSSVIALFVVSEGVLPYLKFVRGIKHDQLLCRVALEHMQEMETEWREEWDQYLAAKDLKDASSLEKMYAAMQQSCETSSKQKVAKSFLALEGERWRQQLTSLEVAAQQTPMLGLGGSLIGCLSSLVATAGSPGLQDSMATMFLTTLVGCAGSFYLLGLSEIGNGRIDRHIAELEAVANYLIDGKSPDGQDDDSVDDSFVSLFEG